MVPTVITGVVAAHQGRPSAAVEVTVELGERLGPSRFRAFASSPVTAGERLVFGDRSNRVCLLGTLEAVVAATNDDGSVTIDFDFHGAALDEMIAAVVE